MYIYPNMNMRIGCFVRSSLIHSRISRDTAAKIVIIRHIVSVIYQACTRGVVTAKEGVCLRYSGLFFSQVSIIIFGTNMYCRSNQPAGFSSGIKCYCNLMCSDKHCHKSLQIICREKSKDVRIKGSFLPFVSMQDFLFFKVVTTHISLCCILLHLCRDVRITLSVVLFGLVTRTLRHRVLV